mmetsp:Transcript_3664/g.8795  ORF Transcript_3664/g.8795 Transcript_3664/m.8795 type:complete len:305 (+) Transcript_3664:3961-4875(+)
MQHLADALRMHGFFALRPSVWEVWQPDERARSLEHRRVVQRAREWEHRLGDKHLLVREPRQLSVHPLFHQNGQRALRRRKNAHGRGWLRHFVLAQFLRALRFVALRPRHEPSRQPCLCARLPQPRKLGVVESLRENLQRVLLFWGGEDRRPFRDQLRHHRLLPLPPPERKDGWEMLGAGHAQFGKYALHALHDPAGVGTQRGRPVQLAEQRTLGRRSNGGRLDAQPAPVREVRRASVHPGQRFLRLHPLRPQSRTDGQQSIGDQHACSWLEFVGSRAREIGQRHLVHRKDGGWRRTVDLRDHVV